MRTLTGAETTVLSSLEYSVYVKISVFNADSSWIDLSSLDGVNYQVSAEIESNLDSPTTATITLVRDFYDYSLAPLNEVSKHNQVSTGYSPLLKLGNYIKIETATIAVDTDPIAGDWKEVFRGIIDMVEFAQDAVITCRDLSGLLQDAFLETATTFGDDGGTKDSEDVIQDVLDAAGLDVTLWCPYGSTFAIIAYKQEADSVYNIIQNIAQQRGWSVRYVYDEDTSAWRLKYYEPDRNRTTYDLEVNPNSYFGVTGISQSIANIRNMVSVVYRNTEGIVAETTYPIFGTATAGAASTLTDSTKAWTVNGWDGYYVTIISGTGIGQTREVASNTATILTTTAVWIINPDNTSKYIITNALDNYTSPQDAPLGYGRRFMRITEGATSQIDTSPEATFMARAIYRDLCEPIAEVQIEMRYLWASEVGDQYLFYANDIHFTEDQTLASVGIRHSLSANKYRTTLICRGKPAGSHRQWLVRESRTGVALANTTIATPTTLALTTGVESAGVDTYSYIRATWDRSPEINLSSYSIRYRKTSTTYWAEVNGIRDIETKIVPLPGNIGYDVQVRAMNSRGVYSEWSATQTVTSQADTTAPSAPTISCLNTAKGFIVYSDGYTPPSDFSHYEIHVGKTVTFTIGGTDPIDWDGTSGSNTYHTRSAALPVIINNMTAGTAYYVKVKAVDTSGNKSSASTEFTIYAGDAQRSDTLVVAAYDASKASQLSADYLCDGTDDDIQINAAINALPIHVFDSGTAQAGAATTITLSTYAISNSTYFVGCTITITGGTGEGQIKTITRYVGNTQVATVSSAWGTNPDDTSTYEIYSACGSVLLSEGTFLVSNPIGLRSGMVIAGSGQNSTKIKCSDASTHVEVIRNYDGAGAGFLAVSNFEVKDFTIDGNMRETAGLYTKGLYLTYCGHYKVSNVKFYDLNCGSQSENNFYFDYYNCYSSLCSYAGYYTNNCSYIIMKDCKSTKDHYGILVAGTSIFVLIDGCYALAATEAGILFTGAYANLCNNSVYGCLKGIILLTCTEFFVTTNTVVQSVEVGIEMSSCAHASVVSNQIQENGKHGILLYNADRNIITNNFIHDNGKTTDDAYSGIYVVTGDDNVITTNHIRYASAGNKAKYGVRINAGTNNNYVYHNDLYQSGKTASLSDAGTGTITTFSGNRT